MKYKVVVSENVSRIVKIEADSGEEALKIAEQRCRGDMENFPSDINWNLDVCLLID